MSKKMYLGNNIFTNGRRTYRVIRSKGITTNTLIGWTQERCTECGRFLGKGKQFLCTPCYEKRHAIQREINHKELRNNVNEYGLRIITEIIQVSLPLKYRNMLRSYV